MPFPARQSYARLHLSYSKAASFPDVSLFFSRNTSARKGPREGEKARDVRFASPLSQSHGPSRFVLVTSSRSCLLRPYLADRSVSGGGRIQRGEIESYRDNRERGMHFSLNISPPPPFSFLSNKEEESRVSCLSTEDVFL